MKSERILIIGGGIGGLFTGALLAKEGYRVTVLEKNGTIGGGLQTFVRQGVTFETGMHVLGGLRKGGNVWKICNYLGILSKIRLRNVDDDCIDSVHYLKTGDEYHLPRGRESMVAYLSNCFPHERENIIAYFDALYRMADEVDFFFLRRGKDELFGHSDEFFMPADEMIAQFIRDEKLRDLLGYMNPMYGGVKGHTPAYIHALINVLYIDGPSRFIDGSQQMATALSDVITSAGGSVLTHKEVVRVNVSDAHVRSVVTRDGAIFSADIVVSDIHPASLIPLCSDGSFTKAYCNRIASAPNTYSAFTLYIIIKPLTFRYINHTCYYQDDYGMVWDHGVYNEDSWPRGFMYMTPPETPDTGKPQWATKVIVNCIMPFSAVKRWENTTTGKRGDDYRAWKKAREAAILERLERLHPGFHEAVDRVYSSTPLTIRDYYHVKDGALYGLQKDCQNMMLSQVPIYTRVKNLYLTGQNINLHGICGVPLTAVNTVEAIIGEQVLVEKINQAADEA